MRRVLSFSLIFLTLILSLQTFPTHNIHAQEVDPVSDAPYIQYYSPSQHAFIIERADGRNSRLFGNGLTPDHFTHVNSAGWSVLGEWFAWVGWENTGPAAPPSPRLGWVLHRGGQQRVTVTDAIDHISLMAWSPVEDLLLVQRGLDNDRSVDFEMATHYLVDVNADAVLFSLDTPLDVEPTWSPDGQFILMTGPTFAAVVSHDGTLLERWGAEQNEAVPQAFAWLPDGRLARAEAGQIVIQNLHDDQSDNAEIAETTSSEIRVLADGNNLLVIGVGDDQTGQSVWMVDGDTLVVEPIAENVSNVRWIADDTLFYESIDPELSTYTLWYFANQSGIQQVYEGEFPISGAWPSPDGQHVIFLTGNQLLHFEASTGQTRLIDTVSITGDGVRQPFPTYVSAEWTADNHAVYLGSSFRNDDVAVYRYDIEANQLKMADEIRNAVDLSPNEEILYYYGNCPPYQDTYIDLRMDFDFSCLLNLNSGERVPLPPPSLVSSARYETADTDWHLSSEWLLVAQICNCIGRGSRYVSIAKADGTMVRDLTHSCFDEKCAFWLPDHVAVEQLPPPSNTHSAPKTLTGHHQPVTVVAWSPDGTQLASASTDETILIWDIESGEIVHRISLAEYHQWVTGLSWSSDGNMLVAAMDFGAIGHKPHLETNYAQGESQQFFINFWDISNLDMPPRVDLNPVAWEVPLPFNPTMSINQYFADDPSNLLHEPPRVWAINEASQQTSGIDVELRVILNADATAMYTVERGASVTRTDMVTGEASTLVTLEVIRTYNYHNNIAISPDERFLAGIGYLDGYITVWDLTNGNIVAEFYSGGNSLAFSPNSTRLAAASSFSIRIWDLRVVDSTSP